MAGPAWTYSDWRRSSLYPDGTQAKLDRLELHIQEVSDFISTGSYSIENKSHDKDGLIQYLNTLEASRDKLAATVAATSGDQTTFVRGIPIRPGEEGR